MSELLCHRASIVLSCDEGEVNVVKNAFGPCMDAADSEEALIESIRKLIADASEKGGRVAIVFEKFDENLAVEDVG